MTAPSSLVDAVARLTNEFSGQLLQPKDPG
jgi:hypothetical protein